MSRPRQILPGWSHLVTRRCTQQSFLLRPSKVVAEVVRYCLAYAAWKTGVKVHSFMVMSNHIHLVVTDPCAVLPKFMHLLNRHIANALNCYYGRSENFWAPGSYSDVQLETEQDILDKIVYTELNPVEAGLVKKAKQWPGLTSAGLPFGTKIEARRPDFYFRDDGDMPAELELELTVPPQMDSCGKAQLNRRLRDRTARREEQCQREAARLGKRFLGAKKCRKVRLSDRPRTKQPHRQLNPRVAGKVKEIRIAAIQRLQTFLGRYREAFERWRNGERSVLFPHGTFGLRVYAKVRCRGPAIPRLRLPAID